MACYHLNSVTSSQRPSPSTSLIKARRRAMTCHFKKKANIRAVHSSLCLARSLQNLLKIWPWWVRPATRRAPRCRIQGRVTRWKKRTWKTIITSNCVWRISTLSGGRKGFTRKNRSIPTQPNGRKMSLTCARGSIDSDLSRTEPWFASLFKSDWSYLRACSVSAWMDNHLYLCSQKSTPQRYTVKPSLNQRSWTN